MLLRLVPGCLLALAAVVLSGCCAYPVGYGELAGCDSGVVGGCDACGCAAGVQPAAHLAAHANKPAACNSGCGEVYWGEWISDPPANCDPCDHCGNWIGHHDCYRCWHLLAGWRHLWGYRFAPSGCAAVSKGAGPVDAIPLEGEDSELIVPPTPSPPEPSSDAQASARRRVRHASYHRPAPR